MTKQSYSVKTALVGLVVTMSACSSAAHHASPTVTAAPASTESISVGVADATGTVRYSAVVQALPVSVAVDTHQKVEYLRITQAAEILRTLYNSHGVFTRLTDSGPWCDLATEPQTGGEADYKSWDIRHPVDLSASERIGSGSLAGVNVTHYRARTPTGGTTDLWVDSTSNLRRIEVRRNGSQLILTSLRSVKAISAPTVASVAKSCDSLLPPASPPPHF